MKIEVVVLKTVLTNKYFSLLEFLITKYLDRVVPGKVVESLFADTSTNKTKEFNCPVL